MILIYYAEYLIDYERYKEAYDYIKDILEKKQKHLFEGDIKINSVLEFETEELIIDAARRNLGIGYVVKPAVQYLVDANILEYIDIKEDLPGMEINLVYINSYLTNIAKVFIEEEISSDII